MTGVITATISSVEDSTETPLNSKYNLISIDIVKDVNRIPTAQLVLLEGSNDHQKFEISDSDFFEPGKKIKIQLRYGDESDVPVFVGFVIKHSIQVSRAKTLLTIDLKDAAIKLTQQRKNGIFRGKDDIAIIKDILGAVIAKDKETNSIDLALGNISPTSGAIAHPEMVQFYCSDWDFILSRAEANGLWILVDDGVISIQAPDTITDQAILLIYDPDIVYDMDIEADIRGQFKSIEAIAWNNAKQESLAEALPEDKMYTLKQPNLTPTELGPIIGADHCQLISGAELEPKEIEAWAGAHLLKNRLSMLKGCIRLPGATKFKVGMPLKLKDFGTRFDGITLITGVRHQVSAGGWQTTIQFGASAKPFAPSDDIIEPPASGLLPAVHGLQVGVVETSDLSALKSDLDKSALKDDLWVQVKIPRLTQNPEKESDKKYDGLVLARLATLDAGLTAPESGQGRGMVFRPEKGDEVVLGFLNDDPRQAVILGSLYSAINKPPLDVVKEKNQKGIFTKQQLKLLFNDDDKSITLETLNGNTIIVSEKKDSEGIQIIDQNKNAIVMNSKGIQISSETSIEITAKENIILQGKKVNVK